MNSACTPAILDMAWEVQSAIVVPVPNQCIASVKLLVGVAVAIAGGDARIAVTVEAGTLICCVADLSLPFVPTSATAAVLFRVIVIGSALADAVPIRTIPAAAATVQWKRVIETSSQLRPSRRCRSTPLQRNRRRTVRRDAQAAPT